ncbi:MAG: radical SAM/SPASM domain-containing protein, partial [Tepidisphaeraceae bacterium]
MNAIAVLSLLHESSVTHSATRTFRNDRVLNWTLRRIARTRNLQKSVILAWDDQLDAIQDLGLAARSCGARREAPGLAAASAAQRWAEGWRGGLQQTCWFDKGFVGSLLFEALVDETADAVVIVDPAAGLVDPALLDELVQAASDGARDFYFMQAAPGLGGVLLKRELLRKLAAEQTLPGRLVHYLPEAPMLDPVTSDACVPVALPVSRTVDRFTLDSQRQIDRIERATLPLNGTLISSESEAIVSRMAGVPAAGAFPRELVLELTTRRSSQPIFNPATHLPIDRPPLTPALLERLCEQIRGQDDLRVTLAGVGDPLCHPQLEQVLQALSPHAALSIETDLIEIDDQRLHALADSRVDIVAVHLPAMRPATYAWVMGVDAMAGVLENIRKLAAYRQASRAGVPLIVPLFQKLAINLDEMESWYDTWLRALGNAVILGPSRFGGRLPDLAAADMTPTVRKPCARIQQRLSILSDGAIAPCEQDPTGQFTIGNIATDTIAAAWTGTMSGWRDRHDH